MAETNKDGFPERFHLLLPERICRVGHFITDQIRHMGSSDHFRGGAAMLDRELYDALGETDEGIEALIQMNQMVDTSEGIEAW